MLVLGKQLVSRFIRERVKKARRQAERGAGIQNRWRVLGSGQLLPARVQDVLSVEVPAEVRSDFRAVVHSDVRSVVPGDVRSDAHCVVRTDVPAVLRRVVQNVLPCVVLSVVPADFRIVVPCVVRFDVPCDMTPGAAHSVEGVP